MLGTISCSSLFWALCWNNTYMSKLSAQHWGKKNNVVARWWNAGCTVSMSEVDECCSLPNAQARCVCTQNVWVCVLNNLPALWVQLRRSSLECLHTPSLFFKLQMFCFKKETFPHAPAKRNNNFIKINNQTEIEVGSTDEDCRGFQTRTAWNT